MIKESLFCFQKDSRVFQECLEGVPWKFQRILKQVSRGFPEDLKEIPGCFKSNSIAFQISFMKISKVLKKNRRSSKEASRVFQENFSEIFHCLVGSKA